MKISVHIPLFIYSNKKNQQKNFFKACNSFLKLSNKTDLFVHTNKKVNFKKKRINFIYHKFRKDHPFKLTWYCRKLMEKQKEKYDIFIYSEDDILFTKKNLNYWLKYKDNCLKNNYNLGFLRVEKNKKNKKLYSTDQISKSSNYVILSNVKYLVPKNPYCGFWIYDKKEFNKFIKTKWWKFKWSLRSKSGILHIREMSSLGWHGTDINGEDMDRYIATIIPLNDKRFDKNSFLSHLSNNYVNSPKGLFGTIKVSDLVNNKLERFKPKTSFEKFFRKYKFLLYSYLRINIKSFFKNNNLHPDLIKNK